MSADHLAQLVRRLEISEPLTGAAIDRVVVAAIHDRALPPVLEALTEAGYPVDAMRAACERLVAANATDQLRLVGLLTTGGIAATVRPLDAADQLVRLVQLDVPDPRNATAAVQQLEAEGFRRWAPTSPGGWRSYLRFNAAVSMTRPDDDAAPRVIVRWNDPADRASSAWSRVVAPTQADYRLTTLPGWAWPLYSVLRPLRLVAERIGLRRRPGQDLGPFLATPDTVTKRLLELAELSPDDVVIDIGCGDGRLVIAAAATFGCRARGLELDAELVAVARAAVGRAGCESLVTIEHGDALQADLTDASVVLLFLPVDVVGHTVGPLLDRLPAGCRVLAHEQHQVRSSRTPDRLVPVVTDGGVTVVSIWTVPQP